MAEMDMKGKLEVIAHLGDHITYKEDAGICYDSALAKVIEDAYMILKNGVTVQDSKLVDFNHFRKWIPVSERLPKGAKDGEISENVIVLTIDGEVTTGWMDALGSDKWWLIIGTDDTHTCWGLGYVTHWMPLPQPPK